MMITNNFTPYAGGVVSSIKALVAELQTAGHEIMLVTLSFGTNDQDPLWVKRVYCPIRFRYKTNYMAMPWRAEAHIKTLMHDFKPDVVHLHHPFLLGRAGLAVAQALHIPTIFTYHTIYEAYAHYVPLPQWLLKKLICWRVLSFCKQVDLIIAPSRYIKEYVSKHVTVPVAHIPSGLLPQFIKPYSEKQHNIKYITLLTVGRMVKEKNVEALLHVAQLLWSRGISFELKLIGYGAQYALLQEYAYDCLKLPKKHVLFVHQPAKEVISQAYQDADLFLFASQTDTQGLVLAEAMAHATPVIALDGPGQRDIIKQGINGYIVDSVEHMVIKIEQLALNPVLLAQLGQGAYQTAQDYRQEFLAQRYIKLCRSFNPTYEEQL